MSKIIKRIKMKQQDGSWSNFIPIGTDAQYVNVNNDNLIDVLNDKATKEEVQAIASGSPAGVYSTVAELTTADPDHSKIYVVTADGHWYYYNNGWQDGGIYQAEVLDDEYQHRVDLLESNFDRNTPIPSDNLTITDAINDIVDGYSTIGKTSQISYTGKNKFNKYGDFNYPTTGYVNRTSLQSDGTIKTTANHAANISRGIQLILKQNTNYTVSGTLISSTGSGTQNIAVVQVRGYSTAWNILQSYGLTSTGNFSFSFNSDTCTDFFLSLNASGALDGSYEAVYDNIQVEPGSSATSYEPYVGGQPSPNPDYPQTISNTTGNINIETSNKNLFNKNNANILNALLGSSGSLTLSSTEKTLYIKCEPSTTYTISKIASKRLRVDERSSTPTIGSANVNRQAQDTGTSLTYITTENANYLLVGYYASTDTLTEQKILNSIQIEEGSSATSYISHQGKSVTFPLAEGQKLMEGDYLAEDGIHHVRGQVILKGTENWILQNVGVGQFSVFIQNVSNRNVPFCNTFKCKMSYEATDKPYMRAANNQIFAELGTEFLNSVSVAEWESYLANKYANNTPVIIETSLDQEVIEPYTSAQQTAWNELQKLETYKGQTHIYTSSDGLAPDSKVTYLVDPLVAISSRLDALETT